LFSKICIIAGFILIAQFSFATEITIRKDDPKQPPPTQTDGLTGDIIVSATIDATELAVYFEESVGDATITVYDASSNVVYQEVVDTDASLEVFISSSTWLSGDYTLTITYGTTDLIGDFKIE
jgi:folate-dependent tRNA-U54 methylase TrmFO/GidA